jgi:hypothetical protein
VAVHEEVRMHRTRSFATVVTLAALLAAGLVTAPAHAAEPRNSVAAPVYKIEFRHSGLCLTVYNWAPMGHQAMQWNCDGYANGRWTFEFVDATWAKIRNVHSGKCLTVYNGSTWASPVMQWNCDGYPNGLWSGRKVQTAGGRDWYILQNQMYVTNSDGSQSRLCLNISSLGPAPLGRPTILGTCGVPAANSPPYPNQATWYAPN